MANGLPNVDPQALASLQAGGFNIPQTLEQGGIPINALRTLELEAAQAGDANRLAAIRTIMDRRKQDLAPQLISAQPQGNFNDNIDQRSMFQKAVDMFNPFRVVETEALGGQ